MSYQNVTWSANIAGVPCVVAWADLPEESKAFIVEYGIKQYVQDGAAVNKEFTDKARKGQKKTADEIAAEKQDGVTERLDNLRTGEFTRRGPAAPKMTPEEKERDAIIMRRLEEKAAALGKTLPTKTGKRADPELLERMKASVYRNNHESIDKEVARRMKELAKAAGEDLTELDAMFG